MKSKGTKAALTKPWLVWRSRLFSIRLDRRVPGVLLVLVLMILGMLIVSIGYGNYFLPPLEVVRALLGQETTNPDASLLVLTLRLPRAIAALEVGMGLAVAGTILQGVTRNPLAAPEIVGVQAGAGLVAVAILVLLPALPLVLLPVAAFVGGLLTALLVYLLAWNRGSTPLRLVLVGIGVAAIATALTTLLITFGEIREVSQALVWLTGSVYGCGWEQVATLLPWLLIFLPMAWGLARELNALTLGDDIARGLGSQVEWQRGLLVLTSVALTGASVAIAGTLGFIGLMAPHLARQLVGSSHAGLIPTAALIGGLIVVAADLVGRSVFAPIELPCGVITAVLGAPYFLYLLRQDYDR
ncbi:FecCD family ABC transporter permease [Phormidesmis sp. 146-35]